MGDPRSIKESFETWATVAAGLRGRSDEERGRILASLGLSGGWAEAERHWAMQLLDEAARGDLERIVAFSGACADEMNRRERGEDRYANIAAAGPSMNEPMRPAVAAPAPVAAWQGNEDRHLAPPSPLNATAGSPPQPPSQGEGSSSLAAQPDFRRGLHDPSQPVRAPPAAAIDPGDFVSELVPDWLAPEIPKCDQTSTATMARNASLIAATKQALAWPPESYAQLSVELELWPERRSAICERFGIAEPLLQAVVRAWDRRLRNDAQLTASHQHLVAHYRKHYGA